MLTRARVAGHSMEPALHHGDELIVLRIPPRVGSVVVAQHPRGDHWVIKRVAEIHGRTVRLASDRDAHESFDVDRSAIVGRAILRYRPVSRLGGLSAQSIPRPSAARIR
jgi:phage repressor protein C with HTH and peptisase S24 domain